MLPSRTRAAPPGRTTSGRWTAGRCRERVGTPARRAARTSSSAVGSSRTPRGALPTGTTSPTPTRSSATMPRRVRRCGGLSDADVRRRAVVVVGVRRAARLLGPERDEHHRQPGPVPGQRLRGREQHADARGVVLGARAPAGRCRGGRRPAATAARADVTAGGHQVDRRPGRHRHAPRDTGRGAEPLPLHRPAQPGQPGLDPRAARKYAGEVPGRGPTSPARWRTAAMAVGDPDVVRVRPRGRAPRAPWPRTAVGRGSASGAGRGRRRRGGRRVDRVRAARAPSPCSPRAALRTRRRPRPRLRRGPSPRSTLAQGRAGRRV